MIPGQKKKSFDRRPGFVSRRLLDYKVPRHLKTLALNPESSLSLLDSFPVLGEELRLENYAEKFKALIHLVRPIAVVISMMVLTSFHVRSYSAQRKARNIFVHFGKAMPSFSYLVGFLTTTFYRRGRILVLKTFFSRPRESNPCRLSSKEAPHPLTLGHVCPMLSAPIVCSQHVIG